MWLTGAGGNGSQAGAVDLHRQGVAGIGDQQRGGGEGRHVDDLTHHAVGVDQRLAVVDPVVFALVDHHLLAIRVEVDRQQFRDQDPVAHARGGSQQFAQAPVLLLQRVQSLQAGGVLDLTAAQGLVVLDQSTMGGQRAIGPAGQVGGQVDQDLQRVERPREG